MADNWLEKREQQLSGGGKIIYRKVNPSLETLLHKLASETGPAGLASRSESGPDAASASDSTTDRVKIAQLEAIARSAKILFPNLELRCDEATGTITWAEEALTTQQTGGRSALTPEQSGATLTPEQRGAALTPEQRGAAILAMQLKACELGFRSQPTPEELVVG